MQILVKANSLQKALFAALPFVARADLFWHDQRYQPAPSLVLEVETHLQNPVD